MKGMRVLAPVTVFVVLLLVLSGSAGASPPLGEGWVVQRPADDVVGGPLSLSAIACASAARVVAVGGNALVTTADGGQTWTVRTLGSTGSLQDVFFLGSTHGWIAGEKLWATLDGGVTWTGQSVGTETQLRQVDFVDPMHGWALGEKLWATSDGGAHWTERPLEFSPGLMSYTDTSTGFVTHSAAALVFRTIDGGSTWSFPIWVDRGVFQAMCFVDSSHGWVANGEPSIAATSDGGTNWVYESLGSFNADIMDIFFLDATHGWAVGQTAQLETYDPVPIYGTSDGGTTWVPQLGLSYYVFGISFADQSHGWAVDFFGRILATKTGGWPPPKTTVSGAANGKWYNKALSLVLSSTPQPPGTSVVSLSYALQGEPHSVAGSSVTVPVPVDAATHVNDDSYTFTYYGTDNLAHDEWKHSLTFGIDTREPTTRALYAATARRGTAVALKYKVLDATPNGGTCKVTIRIKNSAGKVVKTLGPSTRAVNKLLAWKVIVPRTWRAGTYRFYVSALKDTAGNAGSNVASNKLIVK